MKTELNIWFTANEIDTASINDMRGILSSTELQRYNKTKNKRKKNEFLKSRYILRKALSDHFNKPLSYWNVIQPSDNKPLIQNIPQNTHFSISHSKKLIAMSLANTEHGLDIEDTNKKRDFSELSQYAFNDQEHALVSNNENPRNMFYRIWCAKEACFKALAKENQPKSIFDISYIDITNHQGSWHLHESVYQSHQISVVSQNPIIEITTRQL